MISSLLFSVGNIFHLSFLKAVNIKLYTKNDKYNKIAQLDNSKITFTSNSDLIDNKGRVTKQSMTSELVTYTVTYEVDGKTYALELASIIEGLYTK